MTQSYDCYIIILRQSNHKQVAKPNFNPPQGWLFTASARHSK